MAVLGERPLAAEAEQKMKAVIEQGSEPALLPEDIAEPLRSRRRQFKDTGFEYLERRTSTDGGEGR